MAEKLESFLTCNICLETFRDPVSLGCHHSFCFTCLTNFWDQAKNKNCPVCKRKSSKDAAINLSLKDLADSFAGRQKSGSSEERRGEEGVDVACSKLSEEVKTVAGVVRESEVLCSLHSQKLLLFCEEDEELVCLVCQTSRKHRSHTCIPVEEAAPDHKEKFQAALKPLEKKLVDCNKVKLTCEKIAEHIETQTVNTEKQIKEEFKKLHQFLHEEEQTRTAALRTESKEKREKMKDKIEGLNKEIASLSDTIEAIKQKLNADDLSFLQHFRVTEKKAQVTLLDPQLVSGALIDVANHLGNLTFRVWEKMRGVVSFSPVILDPNTAKPNLSLSDDLTSVRCTGSKQQLPDNPERNTKYPTVLGSEGFSSGKHSWEVEVGDHPRWAIGVARESVDRKGECEPSPQYGFWGITQRSGKYINGLRQTLPLKRRLQRIRVQLDWDRGEVSFYDPEDMTHIHTHTDSFTEKLYPHFSIGRAGDAKHPDIQICQSEVSVIVDDDDDDDDDDDGDDDEVSVIVNDYDDDDDDGDGGDDDDEVCGS